MGGPRRPIEAAESARCPQPLLFVALRRDAPTTTTTVLPSALRRRLFASVTLSPIDSRYSDRGLSPSCLPRIFRRNAGGSRASSGRRCHLVAIARDIPVTFHLAPPALSECTSGNFPREITPRVTELRVRIADVFSVNNAPSRSDKIGRRLSLRARRIGGGIVFPTTNRIRLILDDESDFSAIPDYHGGVGCQRS